MRLRRMVSSAVVAGALLGLAGCGPSGVTNNAGDVAGETTAGATATPTAARLLPPGEFAEVIAEPGRTTINVHVPFEGTVPGTDLMIPFDRIEQQASRLPDDRSAPLAVYCMSGAMSAQAAHTLRGLGYTDIVDLDGGMRAWQADGRPIAQSPPGS